ncbi:S-crystallin [Parasponia andersonii]|uniref:glutathione transferase n=1 Tax=Parasponia andersonii TaxID=3476 RepID=A0A2P5DBH9_PARAD|nr:S-crystallin [Parasponia andersonii]
MSIPKLYGSLSCQDTMRVLASIYEHDLQFDFILVDPYNQQTDQVFLSLSPFGQIPVFQDDDLTLFESRAAMRYISHHYPKPGKEQVFEDPKLQGIAATWIDVEDHQFNSPSSKLIRELIENPKKGFPGNQTVVAEEREKLAKVLDVYEERLKEFNYLGGNKFTSADLSHLPNLYSLLGTPLKKLFEERPRVGAWCRDILSRPAWAKVVEITGKNM